MVRSKSTQGTQFSHCRLAAGFNWLGFFFQQVGSQLCSLVCFGSFFRTLAVNSVSDFTYNTSNSVALWKYKTIGINAPRKFLSVPFFLPSSFFFKTSAGKHSRQNKKKKKQNKRKQLFELYTYITPQGSSVKLLSLMISPVLHTLHWLPVEQWIKYKLLHAAFKSVNSEWPSYLSDLLKLYIPSWQLRSSSDSRLLRIPSFRLNSFGRRKFSYKASVLWNSLLFSIRYSNPTAAFISALYTHLFPYQ